MQASAADGGGFKGRSNKLVDGCYGWWVGGSMTCLEALAGLDRESSKGPKGNGESFKPLSFQIPLSISWVSGASADIWSCLLQSCSMIEVRHVSAA
jgi:hypothetical protein